MARVLEIMPLLSLRGLCWERSICFWAVGMGKLSHMLTTSLWLFQPGLTQQK